METEQNFFCPAPWVQASCNTRGKAKYCYYADDSGQKTSIEQYWQSKELEEIRSKILSGKAPQGCSTCLEKERLKVRSYRQEYLDKNYDLSGDYPKELYVKFDNACNLACRMCEPANSSSIDSETKTNDIQPYWHSLKSHHFRQDFESLLPGVEKVRVTGGEPLYSKKFKNFCYHCIEKDLAKNIDLRIITNGTLLSDKWFEVFDRFRKFSMVVSTDGIEDYYDYVRYPAKWQDFPLEYLKEKSTHYKISLTFALQIYNYLCVDSFTKMCNNNNLTYSIHPVVSPWYLSCAILPEKEKTKIKNYVSDEFLFSKSYSTDQADVFFDFTSKLDESRNQSLEKDLSDVYFVMKHD